MPATLSVITPCFNDFPALEKTLRSLQGELGPGDQWVVVDSSQDRSRAEALVQAADLACRRIYRWVPPAGVYPALNAGIEASSGAWVQVLNSGDELLPGARRRVAAAMDQEPEVRIHVFAQRTGGGRGPAGLFRPDGRSLWPHQSIITARIVHQECGLYDARVRLAADQMFFALARRRFPWKIHPEPLTNYDLYGLSTAVSLRVSADNYRVWRALGWSPVTSLVRSHVRPFLRLLLETCLGQDRVTRLKYRIFRHYTPTRGERDIE